MYVDDLPDNVSEGWVFMFFDDTTGYVVADNIDMVIDELNQMAGEIHEWCSKNKLTAHLGKTEAMILAQQPFTGPLKPIYFGGELIKIVTTTQLLGVKIDNKLTWKEQYKKVTKSFSAKLSQLKRMKYLPRYVL